MTYPFPTSLFGLESISSSEIKEVSIFMGLELLSRLLSEQPHIRMKPVNSNNNAILFLLFHSNHFGRILHHQCYHFSSDNPYIQSHSSSNTALPSVLTWYEGHPCNLRRKRYHCRSHKFHMGYQDCRIPTKITTDCRIVFKI